MKNLFAAILLFTASSLLGCTKNDSAGKKFLLPWPDESGQEQLQIIEIQTLNSPYEVSGPAAQVYLQSGFSSTGYLGEPARPDLTIVDGVFVPKDVNSSLGLTIYAHMERIWKMDQELGLASTLVWPRNLGFEILLQKQDSVEMEFNNARYFLDWDLISFLPMSKGTTPLAINPGVIAHEHYHAHFNYRVLRHIPMLTRLSEIQQFNEQVILRGWNEGLSDYYGFVYSENGDFLQMSLGEEVGISRDLAVTTPHIIRSAAYHSDLFHSLMSSGKPVGGLGYRVGTDIARVLYWLVEGADEAAPIRTHRDMLAFVTKNIDRIPAFYLQNYDEGKLEPAALLKLLFQEGEPVLTGVQCDILLDTVPYVFTVEGMEGKCL